MADRYERIHTQAGQLLGTIRVFGGRLNDDDKTAIAEILQAARARYHDCLGPGCRRRLPMSHAFCRGCWKALPLDLRRRIQATYRPGQTATTASPEYLDALLDAVTILRTRKGTRRGRPPA